MIDSSLVDLSRFQFALTAMYHFIFVPLTLGLAWILVVMEACYVMSGKEIYRDKKWPRSLEQFPPIYKWILRST